MSLVLSIPTRGNLLNPDLSLETSNSLYCSSLIASIRERCKFPSEAESDRIISGMRYFGLFSSEKATIRRSNLLDTLCGQLEKLLSFQPGERDLVMLQHKFIVEWKDGKKVSHPPYWMECQKLRYCIQVLSPSAGLKLLGASRTPSLLWLLTLCTELHQISRSS